MLINACPFTLNFTTLTQWQQKKNTTNWQFLPEMFFFLACFHLKNFDGRQYNVVGCPPLESTLFRLDSIQVILCTALHTDAVCVWLQFGVWEFAGCGSSWPKQTTATTMTQTFRLQFRFNWMFTNINLFMNKVERDNIEREWKTKRTKKRVSQNEFDCLFKEREFWKFCSHE